MADTTLALPLAAFTTTLPVPTVGGDTTLGLPVVAFTTTVAALSVNGQPFPPASVHATVYHLDGLTYLGSLRNVRGVQWQEQLNKAGSATFEVPLDDPTTALLTMYRIVKFTLYVAGVPRAAFGVRLQSCVMQHAVDGQRWLRFESQAGLLSLLADAVIFPEYSAWSGINVEEQTAPDRHFGWMGAAGGAWYIPSQWVTPRTANWGTGIHGHSPPDFRDFDPTAKWISVYDPNSTQTANAEFYGRAAFYIDDDMEVQIICGGDDFLDVWVDGQPVITADRTAHNQWTQAQSTTVRVNGGAEHIVAIYCANAPFVPHHANAVAAILSIREVDASGNPTGFVLLNTNADDWLVNDGSPAPEYHKGALLNRLFLEANTRGVLGVQSLQHGFTDTHDNNGKAWTDLIPFVAPVGTQNYLEVATTLCEQGMDMRVAPSTLTWKLYQRLGRDLSATVELATGDDGGNLKSYETSKQAIQATSILAQTSTGQWTLTHDDAAITAVGGIVESGVTIGSVDTIAGAHTAAGHLLDVMAHPLTSITAETALKSPLPYVDYDLGDTIAVPNADHSATIKARCVAISVDATGDVVRVWPELEQDLS